MARNFKRNINPVYAKDPFWGKYIDLNNVVVPDVSMIQNYQLTKIKMFSQDAQQRAAQKNASLNALFESGQINSLPGLINNDENYQLDKALTAIVGMMNGTYKSQKTETSDYNYDQLRQTLQGLYNKINELNSVILKNSKTGIPEHYLTELRAALNACKIESLNPIVLDNWFKHLNKFKGDFVEDAGVAWLSANKIPNITTINTGALNFQGEKTHHGQIIQDLMMLKGNIPDLENIPIEYQTPDGKLVNSTLGRFFKDMEKASANHKQLILYDAGYDTLLGLSQLNIQAKAGINQKPWNTNKSTSVRIYDFADSDDNLVISVKKTFDLLNSLDKEHQPDEDWVRNESGDYNLLADYGLATVLIKVLHLSDNEYLLTPQGFVSYADRLAYLMEKGNGRARIHIKEKVQIRAKNDDTLKQSYNVDMTKN